MTTARKIEIYEAEISRCRKELETLTTSPITADALTRYYINRVAMFNILIRDARGLPEPETVIEG